MENIVISYGNRSIDNSQKAAVIFRPVIGNLVTVSDGDGCLSRVKNRGGVRSLISADDIIADLKYSGIFRGENTDVITCVVFQLRICYDDITPFCTDNAPAPGSFACRDGIIGDP